MVETTGGRRLAAFFLAAAFLVLLLGRWLRPVDNAAQTVLAPFAAVVSGVSAGIGDTVGGVLDAGRLRSENAALKKQNSRLIRQLILSTAQRHDYALMARMLNFEDRNSHMDLLPARVIWNDPTGISSYDEINKGSRDGLREGMTVLDQNGYFVGSITDVTSSTSRVLLLSSPSSSVGAVDFTTRAPGVVFGNINGYPQLRDVVTGQKLKTGDLVVTSGQLNLFPRNLLIGQITHVSKRTDQIFQTVDVHPAADLAHLEIVSVVRNWVPTVPAQFSTSQ